MGKPLLTIVRTPQNHLHFDLFHTFGPGEDNETTYLRIERNIKGLIDVVQKQDPNFGLPFLTLIGFPEGSEIGGGYRIDEGYHGGGPKNTQPDTSEGLAKLIDTIQRGAYVPEMGVIGPVKGVVEFIGPKDYGWESSPLNDMYDLKIVDLG